MRRVHISKLDNGLSIIVAEEHSLPIVCSTLWYRTGARWERDGQSGLAHFLEHMMFKGSARYPKGVIDTLSLRLGGNNNAFTSYDYTCYYFTFSSDRWEIALDIEADRMQNLLLDPEEFAAEKRVVMEELKMGEDNPWGYLRKEVSALALRRHPYRRPIIGWREDLENLTLEDMRQFYGTYYQPGNAFLVITGDVTAHQVERLTQKNFGSIIGQSVSPPTISPETPAPGTVRFRAAKPAHISRLLLAFHGPSVRQDDIYAMNLLRYILAEGKTSRLYHRLIEQDQSVSSFAIYFEDMADPSLLMMGSELKDQSTFDDVESAIQDELDKIFKDGFTSQELTKALNQLESDFIFEQEDISSLAVNLGMYECLDSHRFYTSFLENAKAVTLDHLLDAARRYLRFDCCTIGQLEKQKTDAIRQWDLAASADLLRPIQQYTPSDAQPAQPTPPLMTGQRGPAVQLPIETHQLENGLTVMLCPMHRIPAVTMSVVVLAGSREDEAGTEGLAYMVGNMLDEGTARHTHLDIATYIDGIGGELESFAGRESAGITMKMLREHMPAGLALLREMMFESIFPVERLELTRSQIITRIASLEDRPDYLGSREFSRLVYNGTPLAHPTLGYLDTVEQLTRSQICSFYNERYTPANTILVIVGDLDPRRIMDQIREEWGALPGSQGRFRPTIQLEKQSTLVRRRLTVEEKEQHHIFLGHLGICRNNPDYYKLLVMDVILGSGPGFTSRIPKILRDELGLAYTTFASICSTAGLDPGRFLAYIGTDPQQRDVAIHQMIQEIRKIRDQEISAEELTAAQDYLTGSFVFKFETMSQIASFMVAARIHGLGLDYTSRFPDYIRSVTAADVQMVARKYLDPENVTIVEVGPANGVNPLSEDTGMVPGS